MGGKSSSTSQQSTSIKDTRSVGEVVAQEGATVNITDKNAQDTAKLAIAAQNDATRAALEAQTKTTSQALEENRKLATEAFSFGGDSLEFAEDSLENTLDTFTDLTKRSFDLAQQSQTSLQTNARQTFEFVDDQRSSELKNIIEPVLTAGIWLFGGGFLLKQLLKKG
jgi:hypothetical protein